MKRTFFILSAVVALSIIMISALTLVSAEIMLSQPNETYSIGDDMFVSATLKLSADANSLLEMSLLCNEEERIFFVSPAKLSANEERKFETSLTLSNPFLQGIRGDCRITAKFLDEYAETLSFKVTDRIDITLKMNKSIVEPGENILIEGGAIKANKKPANGFVQLSVSGTNVSAAKAVENGKFTLSFSMPEKSKAGEYSIMLDIYEKDSHGGISNEGIATATITIKQIPTMLEIITEKQDYMPGENLSIITILYDQAKEVIASEISTGIFDAGGNDVFEALAKSNEELMVYLEKNSTLGKWSIRAKSSGKEAERLIFIKENEEASFNLQGSMLTITNIGNVPYRKSLEIRIGNETEIKEPKLNVGENIVYELKAPDGDYEILINDGKSTIKGNSYLTGNAISVDEIVRTTEILVKHPFVWVFLVLVMAMFIFLTARRAVRQRVSVAVEPSAGSSFKEKGFVKIKPKAEKMQASDMNHIFGKAEKKESAGGEIVHAKMSHVQSQIQQNALKRSIREAESALVSHGIKENACIVVLSLKNHEQVKRFDEARKAVEKAFSIIQGYKAPAQIMPAQVVIVLSPSITRTFRNDITAVNIAKGIADALNEHNKRFESRIEYGIGINTGMIVSRIEGNKLKFTSLGNTLPMAKKIADAARNEVLLSRETMHAAMSKVKTERKNTAEVEAYSVSRVVEREKNKEFIQRFLERQKGNVRESEKAGLDEML